MEVASEQARKRAIRSWVMYDWANSAFATTVMAGFFPVFFKSYWATGMSATESTVRLGTANALASLLVVLLAPLLGLAIALIMRLAVSYHYGLNTLEGGVIEGEYYVVKRHEKP